MKNLVYIESPLQAMSFIEYLYQNKIQLFDCVIIINKNSIVSNQNFYLIQNVFDFYNLNLSDDIIMIDLNVTLGWVLNNRDSINELLYQVSVEEYSTFFVGEYRSLLCKHLFNSLNIKTVVFLDDGNAITRAVKQRSQLQISSILKKIIAYIMGIKISDYPKVTFFSAFLGNTIDSDKDELLVNNFDKLAMLNRNATNNGNINVGVIGSPLSSAGVCSEEYELKALKELLKFAREKNPEVNLSYFPHRRESIKKLNIVKSLGFIVDERQLPIELKLLGSEHLRLFGNYSSCFENLLRVYQNVHIFSVALNLDKLNGSWRDFVSEQYSTYENNGKITIVKEFDGVFHE